MSIEMCKKNLQKKKELTYAVKSSSISTTLSLSLSVYSLLYNSQVCRQIINFKKHLSRKFTKWYPRKMKIHPSYSRTSFPRSDASSPVSSRCFIVNFFDYSFSILKLLVVIAHAPMYSSRWWWKQENMEKYIYREWDLHEILIANEFHSIKP